MKFNIELFGRTLQLRYFPSPKIPISGYTSKTTDGNHVLFLDYDYVSPTIVQKDIETLSEWCSHFYIFCTDEKTDSLGVVGNYHVICIDKFTFNDVCDLMQLTHSDSAHRNLAKKTRYRAWVLRFTGKGARNPPVFKRLVHNGWLPPQGQSQAHKLLIETLYPETKTYTDMWEWVLDDSSVATVTNYNTVYEAKH